MPLAFTIEGIQQAQRDNLKMIRTLDDSNGPDVAARVASAYLHRYAVIYTHVDTGALKASHRIDRTGRAEYTIHIADNNPGWDKYQTRGKIIQTRRKVNMSKKKPSVYGVEEHDRGDTHAFYERAFTGHGQRAAQMGLDTLERMLNA